MSVREYTWVEKKGDDAGYDMRRNNKVVGEVTFDQNRHGWVWRAAPFYGVDAYSDLRHAKSACESNHENDLNYMVQLKRVWILGSGFSKGVGGPLLNELLTPSSQDRLIAQYAFAPRFKEVYELYWRHHAKRREDEAPAKTPMFWENAEEFLTFIDSVNRGGYRAKMFSTEHPDVDVKALYRKCIQAVAAECCFTENDQDLEAEHWQPYVDWAELLTPHDTIVTFNYDMVLEGLAKAKGKGLRKNGSFILPDDPALAGHSEEETPVFSFTRVYKLHGSVNWLVDTQDAISIAPPLTILEKDLSPMIATPGPTKKLHANGPLVSIWHGAMKAIAQADTIVFVGYRFPPSDSEARSKILPGIGAELQPNVKIHTVLGPKTGEDDCVRLHALLESTLRAIRSSSSDPVPRKHNLKFHIQTHPLYTQDFLSVLYLGMLDDSNVSMFDDNEVIRRP